MTEEKKTCKSVIINQQASGIDGAPIITMPGAREKLALTMNNDAVVPADFRIWISKVRTIMGMKLSHIHQVFDFINQIIR